MRRLAVLAAAALALSACMPPSWGAAALLHPYRRPVPAAPALPHEELAFDGEGASRSAAGASRPRAPRAA